MKNNNQFYKLRKREYHLRNDESVNEEEEVEDKPTTPETNSGDKPNEHKC